MSYTTTDIENLERAMARGVLEVEYSGRRVRYQSLAEMRAQLSDMRTAVEGTARQRYSDTLYDRT